MLRCGKFVGFARPGCLCVGPFTALGPIIELTLKQSPVKIETRTKDNVWIHIEVVVHWRVCLGGQDISVGVSSAIADMAEHHDGEAQTPEELRALDPDLILYRASFSSDSPLMQITAHTEEYFRITVAQHTMDKLFDLGNTLTTSCQALLNSTMNEYGFCVQKVVINSINPENQVKAAMNDIVASEKERLAAITRACAEKERRIKIAEAAAEVSRLHGEGLANQRFAIVEGLKANVDEFSVATQENQEAVMALLLMTQYTDTLKESIQNNRRVTLILNGSGPMGGGGGYGTFGQGGEGGVEASVRNALLQTQNTAKGGTSPKGR